MPSILLLTHSILLLALLGSAAIILISLSPTCQSLDLEGHVSGSQSEGTEWFGKGAEAADDKAKGSKRKGQRAAALEIRREGIVDFTWFKRGGEGHMGRSSPLFTPFLFPYFPFPFSPSSEALPAILHLPSSGKTEWCVHLLSKFKILE